MLSIETIQIYKLIFQVFKWQTTFRRLLCSKEFRLQPYLHNSFSEKLLPCKTGALLATFRKLLLTAALFQLLLKDSSALRQNRNLLFHNFSQRFSSIGGNSSHICNLFQDSTVLLKSRSLLYLFSEHFTRIVAICNL
jgi:hypothetical protein